MGPGGDTGDRNNRQYTLQVTAGMAALLRFVLLSLVFLAWPVAQAFAEAGGEINAGNAAEPTVTSPVEDSADDGEGTSIEPDEAAPATPGDMPRDVVLVLDNSGSMRQNDPQSLAPAAVEQFIRELGPGNRVAVLIFDQEVTLAQDFVSVDGGRTELLGSLEAIDYGGQYTDSPAAIERAIYKLKNEARPGARRIIIFMTDGIVDTGNPESDASRSEWLRTDLAADAVRAGIQIFAIAFTNDADFQLIQSLANKTEGDYFRALRAVDLGAVFDRINEAIARQAEPEPQAEPARAEVPVQQVVQAPSPEPIIIEVPAQTPGGSQEERTRTLILIIAASVLCLTLLAILVVLIKRSRAERQPEEEYEPKAFLSDIHGITEKQSHELDRRPTMIGRVAGTDTDHLNYIVIPETTVGRRHALIEYKDYAYWIIDQGSINGTYVNDRMVTTETRLKHGDRIRLHKFEFEFVMPEMFDSGMTVVSKTVYAGDIAGDDEQQAAPAAGADKAAPEAADYGNLFDITGHEDDSSSSAERITLSEEDYNGNDSEDATIQYDEAGPEPGTQADQDEDDEDATLTPGMDPMAEDDKTMHRLIPKDGHDSDDSDEWDISDDGHGRRDD